MPWFLTIVTRETLTPSVDNAVVGSWCCRWPVVYQRTSVLSEFNCSLLDCIQLQTTLIHSRELRRECIDLDGSTRTVHLSSSSFDRLLIYKIYCAILFCGLMIGRWHSHWAVLLGEWYWCCHKCSSAFRSRPWTTWPYQWCSTWTTLATDWAAHHIQTRRHHALCFSRHRTGVHLRLSHSSVHCVQPLHGLYDITRTRTLISSKAFLVASSTAKKQTTAVNIWNFVNSRF